MVAQYRDSSLKEQEQAMLVMNASVYADGSDSRIDGAVHMDNSKFLQPEWLNNRCNGEGS